MSKRRKSGQGSESDKKRIQRSYWLTREDAAGILQLNAALILASEEGNFSLSDVVQALIREGLAAHREGGQRWMRLVQAVEAVKATSP